MNEDRYNRGVCNNKAHPGICAHFVEKFKLVRPLLKISCMVHGGIIKIPFFLVCALFSYALIWFCSNQLQGSDGLWAVNMSSHFNLDICKVSKVPIIYYIQTSY